MYTLVNNPPTTTIYCCERGGIHLVIQNINIGTIGVSERLYLASDS